MSDGIKVEKLHQTLQSWASVAPLMACILGPLSILLGIPALSQRWRGYVQDNVVLYTLPDPGLNIILASLSLACEVFANAVLMLRFSSIAVEVTTRLSLALWIAKVAICLGNYVQFIIVHPQPHDLTENWTYLEGFWIGCASMVISTIVIVFLILNLTISPARRDLGLHEHAIMEQHRLAHRGFMFRVLILVLAMGFGALAFSKLEDFSFVTALYLVTASILTVGFGDVALTTAAGKIILFPYLVFSITYVALMISSIANLIDERLDAQKQLRDHLQQVTKVTKKQQQSQLQHALGSSNLFMMSMLPQGTQDIHDTRDAPTEGSTPSHGSSGLDGSITLETKDTPDVSVQMMPLTRHLTLQEEISEQAGTAAHMERRRQLRNIFLALLFFSIFWLVGAIVFAYSEGWAYGEGLYFCYVFFMTVGYGDYSPKSQLGRVLFIVYAMIAVPTVTFLVQVFVEAADISKYVYNTKRSRQHRISELDTRDFHEIKKHVTQDRSSDFFTSDLGRNRSVAAAGQSFRERTRTMSRSVTIENDQSIIVTQTIRMETPSSPQQMSLAHQETTTNLHSLRRDDDSSSEDVVDDEPDDESLDKMPPPDSAETLAAELIHSEISARVRLLQNARKLDHLTRLLISPHLHQEARLLLSLEMGRLDSHYKQLLRLLSHSHMGPGPAPRDWMEDTREAEWLGLTGIERERKFVIEYRECFAGLLSDVERLVTDVVPITSTSPTLHPTEADRGVQVVSDSRREMDSRSIEKESHVERKKSGIKWVNSN